MEESVLFFRCTVCEGDFISRETWLEHLLIPSHSDAARLELIRNFKREKMKKRVIVAFSKRPVAKDDRILQCFSNDIFPCVVADFVWWPERPGVGFLMFESSKKAYEVVSLHNQQVNIDGQLFQLKQGCNFLDIEWDELLPQGIKCEAMIENGGDDNTSLTSSMVRSVSESLSSGQAINSSSVECSPTEEKSNSSSRSEETENYPSFQVPSTSSSSSPNLQQLSPPEPLLPLPPRAPPQFQQHINNVSSGSVGFISRLLSLVHAEVEISDSEYNSALKLLSLLRKTFSNSSFVDPDSEFKIWFTRPWSLKLRYQNEYSKYVTVLVLLKSTESNVLRQLPEINSKIVEIIKRFPSSCKDNNTTEAVLPPIRFERLKEHANLTKEKVDKLVYLQYLIKKHNSPSCVDEADGFPPFFQIVGRNALAGEAQLWHLTKYMCSFDPRCEPLLGIVYYWANHNSISAGVQLDGRLNPFPDPIGLTLLVLFFLFKTNEKGDGVKIIPTPIDILSLPHEPLFSFPKAPDIGFFEDPDFREDWIRKNQEPGLGPNHTNKFSLNVLKLARDFFTEFKAFMKGEGVWILNARNGRTHQPEKLLKFDFKKPNQEKMDTIYRGSSAQEWIQFQTVLRKEMNKHNTVKKPCERELTRIKLINPFSLSWSIPVDGNIFKAMYSTGVKLRNFLEQYENGNIKVNRIRLDKDYIEYLFKTTNRK